uniref:Integral membrane protein n=1 Tax=Streptomyces sp. NBC_00003 TaxID=2903608 RepID=A0AAU2V4N5_9ACTN
MGIESDQLVYDYLSRVGDLAQQRQLPSGDRMRLVSSLRNEIDKQRAKYGSETPATVRRVLGRFGTPEEVVERAAGGSGADFGSGSGSGAGAGPASGSRSGSRFGSRGSYVPEPAPDVAVPVQRDRLFPGRGKRVPRPREVDETPPALPTPPHLAGMDELGTQGVEPDWWRVEPGPLGGDSVPGFVGGVEIPDLLKPPGEGEEEKAERAESVTEAGEDEDVEADDLVEEAPVRRRLRPRLRRSAEVRSGLTNPLLLIAAALLVAGALFGLWLALGAGWLLAYASRRLSRAESKWAVLGMPGLTLLGGLIWLWGRQDGRWGDPIAQGEMGAALTGMWPWLIRVAAVSSAAFLVWRSQRGGR